MPAAFNRRHGGRCTWLRRLSGFFGGVLLGLTFVAVLHLTLLHFNVITVVPTDGYQPNPTFTTSGNFPRERWIQNFSMNGLPMEATSQFEEGTEENGPIVLNFNDDYINTWAKIDAEAGHGSGHGSGHESGHISGHRSGHGSEHRSGHGSEYSSELGSGDSSELGSEDSSELGSGHSSELGSGHISELGSGNYSSQGIVLYFTKPYDDEDYNNV